MKAYLALLLGLGACTPAMMEPTRTPCPPPEDAVVKRRVIETTLEKEPKQLGQAHGPWRRFYDNGQLEEVGCYHHGEQAGEWRQFYPDGRIRSVRTFGGPACELETN